MDGRAWAGACDGVLCGDGSRWGERGREGDFFERSRPCRVGTQRHRTSLADGFNKIMMVMQAMSGSLQKRTNKLRPPDPPLLILVLIAPQLEPLLLSSSQVIQMNLSVDSDFRHGCILQILRPRLPHRDGNEYGDDNTCQTQAILPLFITASVRIPIKRERNAQR
jgi:hypothetical protein